MKRINDLPKGLRVLAVEDELNEVLAVLNGKGEAMITKSVCEHCGKELDYGRHCPTVCKEPLRLQYLKGSAKMGLRLWNVLSPQVEGYKYGPDSGVPTFSLDTLKDKGLLKWF
jgi:hypothetical protein